MTVGRPTIYCEDIVNRICEEIATSKKGIEAICKNNPDLPDYKTIFNWLRKYPEFLQRYTLAKDNQAEFLVDHILDIIDCSHIFKDENGNEKPDATIMRVKIEALKWQAGKLKPKKYAEKPDTTTVVVKHEDWLKDIQK